MKLLTALLGCHYLADFCLTMPVMIWAKADGSKPRRLQSFKFCLHSPVMRSLGNFDIY